MNNTLSKQEYWEETHKTKPHNATAFKSYSNQYLINLCKKYIPSGKLKFIEVGCAPGSNAVDFHNAFGFDVYGVDYSIEGYFQTINTFHQNGLYTINNVIFQDFLSNTFQSDNKDKYDVVFSTGFLEHFDNPREIVDMHLNILKSNGYLIIVIPNLLGVNRILSNFFNPEIIPMCNTEIMDKSKFASLFNRNGLETLYCGYYGLFNLGLFNAPQNSFKSLLMSLCYTLQFGMDRILERTMMNRNIEYNMVSPYLVYIGKKV